MTENDCRILARACNLQWSIYPRPTFSTADDWELVRVKVVVPNWVHYKPWLWEHLRGSDYSLDLLGEFVILSPIQQNQNCANWVKSRPDLFPWVREMMEEEK